MISKICQLHLQSTDFRFCIYARRTTCVKIGRASRVLLVKNNVEVLFRWLDVSKSIERTTKYNATLNKTVSLKILHSWHNLFSYAKLHSLSNWTIGVRTGSIFVQVESLKKHWISPSSSHVNMYKRIQYLKPRNISE